MPFIRVSTNCTVDESSEKLIICELGRAIECISGKTEGWLMIEIDGDKKMAFAGDSIPCAMVEVDLFGAAAEEEKSRFTEHICGILKFILDLPPRQVYVRYLETDSWGWNGQNF